MYTPTSETLSWLFLGCSFHFNSRQYLAVGNFSQSNHNSEYFLVGYPFEPTFFFNFTPSIFVSFYSFSLLYLFRPLLGRTPLFLSFCSRCWYFWAAPPPSRLLNPWSKITHYCGIDQRKKQPHWNSFLLICFKLSLRLYSGLIRWSCFWWPEESVIFLRISITRH